MVIVEKENGKLSIKSAKDKSGDLKDADMFLQNGVHCEDPKAKETYFIGQEFVHVFDKTSHRFKTLRKINGAKR